MKPTDVITTKSGLTATLYLADCLDVLPTLGKVDAVITDPPYGLREKLQGGTWGKAFEGEYKNWDAAAAADVSWLTSLESRAKVVWGGNYFALPASRGWLVWNKPERGLTMADAELAWTNLDQNIRTYDCSRNPDGPTREHPTQKPLRLLEWTLRSVGVKPGDTVLDGYMGSGTTGVAALRHGCNFIGIEIEPKYYEIAKRRIQAEAAQGKLFV
jgi:site-specific DNA-methyltransferase (adenine-specific)